MLLDGVGEVYRVHRTEELILGEDAYRIEVLRCTHHAAMEPGALEREPFSVRVYKRTRIEIHAHGSPGAAPVTAIVWAHFPLDDVRANALEDVVLDEAHAALLEVVNRSSKG